MGSARILRVPLRIMRKDSDELERASATRLIGLFHFSDRLLSR